MSICARAAVARQPGGPFMLEDVVIDEPRADEVIVRIVACGVCHTDIAARDGLFDIPLPAVFGHEGAGVVESAGNKSSRFRAGDKVALSFSSCGRCPSCQQGHPARCAAFDALNFSGERTDGTPAVWDANGESISACFFGQSSFSSYALVRERSMIPVETADEEELATLAPLGCGIQTGVGTVLNELRPGPGQSVAVFGAGAVGLSAIMAARLAEADPIVAVDIVPSRLELAAELGATVTIDGRGMEMAHNIREIAGEIDCAVDTTGVSRVIDQAMRCLGPQGKLSKVGIPADEPGARIRPKAPEPGQTSFFSIAGDSNPQTFLPFLIQRYREGKFPINRLIRQYPASEINAAVEDSLRGTTVKPVVRF